MAIAPVKKAAHDLIDQLPDDITWDDLAYKIEVRASIERGLADAEAGRTTSQEDMEKLYGITQ
jgi:predicted transcriptional regulator